ncbi:MAG TPA: bifunctional diguanylate cyclase/phosphodiesterase [Micromonosporaceae bacterium]|nr:bifunctional diguanylate cyclase/phosphodiesterase [Micromonosporaceae bacterium]
MTGAQGEVPCGAPETQQAVQAGLRAFAQAWARAVVDTSYVSMDYEEIEKYLYGLAEHLAAALRTSPFSSLAGYEVGTRLVAADFDSPETLGRTVAVIHERLLPGIGLSGHRATQHLALLLDGLATGYTRARFSRTLDAQEALRRAAMVVHEDVEETLRRSEARFRHQATHDPLTGLPNRALVGERLAEIFASPKPGARIGVCFIDLDGFKAVNDSFGHDIGDQLLTGVASRLSEMAAESGYLVARLGGDEFVILVEDTTCTDDAVKVADKALTVLSEPIWTNGRWLSISASIGVVERPVAGSDPRDVLRSADITLYWAKADGKRRWAIYDPDRSARDVARYRLAAELPAALERNEFRLSYQPMVDLAEGTICGVEALVRWHHPEHGILSPKKFIDLAEDTNLIVPLGRHLLRQACRQAMRWQRAPAPPFVSVNLSVCQIRHPGLVADVAEVLDRSRLPADRLHLEITESTAMGTDQETVSTLHALADLGVSLSIDDFGTGYSNLAYLRRLPVHELKLAGSFIRGLHPSEPVSDDELIVSALVSLGHKLGLSVVAEGIETEAQAHRVREIGCDIGQGYHLGRPQSPERVTKLLARPRHLLVG